MPRRKHKTPTRTFTNAGPMPRYTGYFPTDKTPLGAMVFDSIASLDVALFLDFLPSVKQLDFEPEKFEVETKLRKTPTRKIIPDYRVIDQDGEVSYKEAKSKLKDKERVETAENKVAMEAKGFSYEVIEASALVAVGVPETLLILRKYRNLELQKEALGRVLETCQHNKQFTLEGWVTFSQENNLNLREVYYLLANSMLPLEFQRIRRYEVRYV